MEMEQIHEYGVIMALLFSKFASPISPKREHNGKHRLLDDLTKIKTHVNDNYINKNQPVSTLAEAANI